MEGTLVVCRGQLPPRAVVFTRSQGRMFLSTDETWFLHPDPQRLHQRFSTYTKRKSQQNQPNPKHNPQNTDSKRWAGWKRCYQAIASQPQQHRFGRASKTAPAGHPHAVWPNSLQIVPALVFSEGLKSRKNNCLNKCKLGRWQDLAFPTHSFPYILKVSPPPWSTGRYLACLQPTLPPSALLLALFAFDELLAACFSLFFFFSFLVIFYTEQERYI